MLSYDTLKNKDREFLAATGLKQQEFQQLVPAFEIAYEQLYPSGQTREGKPRQRRIGGGTKAGPAHLNPFGSALLSSAYQRC